MDSRFRPTSRKRKKAERRGGGQVKVVNIEKK